MEQGDPAVCNVSFNQEGKDEMTKASIDLQDLRPRLYLKAKADTSWRFWGLYVHVCKMETLREAYALAKENDGAPGIDGVTFEAIEEQGVDAFLKQIRDELVQHTYEPLPARRQEIPKDGGKVRVLSIPAIRDRVVQGSLKLILEPIFEADFQPGSFGYRPKKRAHDAIDRVAQAIVRHKTRVLDLDLQSYFDNVRHDRLLANVWDYDLGMQMLRFFWDEACARSGGRAKGRASHEAFPRGSAGRSLEEGFTHQHQGGTPGDRPSVLMPARKDPRSMAVGSPEILKL